MEGKNKKSVRLGDLLIDLGKITIEQLDNALLEQKNTNKKLGEILVEKNYFTENELLEILSEQTGIERVNLSNYNIRQRAVVMIPEVLARRLVLIAVDLDKNRNIITVAMSDPLNIYAIEDVKMATGMQVKTLLASKSSIINNFGKYYGRSVAETAAEQFAKENAIAEIEDVDAINDNLSNAPVVKLVDVILNQAVKYGASDIHIEPFEDIVRIRYRIDGQLIEMMTPTKNVHSALVTRIKIMASLNIAEKRVPQDGRIEIIIDTVAVDLRISILPTVYGEKVVIRILNRNSFMRTKKELGFSDHNEKLLDETLKLPNGIVLVTGPTGSGKTTTLYTILNEINDSRKNIITVEDPVEYKLDGINQVQVNEKAGLMFSTGLRSILRQDPDIIMIGEIRDSETAEIAVRAAITGHLVVSTIHTNDAASTIIRLIDIGIPPYLIISSLRGIVAQRLVKKVCPKCEEEYEASLEEKNLLGIEENERVILHRGKGCPFCHGTGYSGRIAVHEVLKLNRNIREVLYKKDVTTDDIKDVAVKEGLITLFESCKDIVLDGTTTIDEMINIGFSLD